MLDNQREVKTLSKMSKNEAKRPVNIELDIALLHDLIKSLIKILALLLLIRDGKKTELIK